MVIFVIIFTTLTYRDHTSKITQWSKDHNYTLVDKEMCWTVFGTPFNYCGKGQSIYKLTLKKNNKIEIWYVRTDLFSNTYLKK